MSDNQTGESKS